MFEYCLDARPPAAGARDIAWARGVAEPDLLDDEDEEDELDIVIAYSSVWTIMNYMIYFIFLPNFS